MSGTAPSDPAPGGHPEDRGVEQTSLDSNQHGAAQNIIDETKDTFGSKVDSNVGEAIDAGRSGGGISGQANEILNKSSEPGNAGAQRKSDSISDQGFKVGAKSDLHNLAQSKQP